MTAVQPQTVVRQLLLPRQVGVSHEPVVGQSPFGQGSSSMQQGLHYMLQWHDHHASFFRYVKECWKSVHFNTLVVSL